MAKFKCGPERNGVKVCTRPDGSKARVRAVASAATKAKRKAAAKRLKPFRFTKSIAKACAPLRGRSKKAFGKCMGKYVAA